MFERYRHLGRVVYSASGQGSGGGGGGGAGEGGGEQPQRRSSADVLQQYGGDAIRMADRVATLEAENYRYREQRRDLSERVKALEGKQVPEGAVVLTADDAKAYEAYKGLGKPDEVKTRLDERDTLATEVATAKRDGLLRDAAQATGFKFSVLRDRAGELPIEVREVEEDGTKVARAFAKPQGGAEKPLADYAAEHWADYLPALQAGQGNGGTSYPAQSGSGGGVNYPAQRGGQGQPKQPTGTSYVSRKYGSRPAAGR